LLAITHSDWPDRNSIPCFCGAVLRVGALLHFDAVLLEQLRPGGRPLPDDTLASGSRFLVALPDVHHLDGLEKRFAETSSAVPKYAASPSSRSQSPRCNSICPRRRVMWRWITSSGEKPGRSKQSRTSSKEKPADFAACSIVGTQAAADAPRLLDSSVALASFGKER
jgi:hypothetical protein